MIYDDAYIYMDIRYHMVFIYHMSDIIYQQPYIIYAFMVLPLKTTSRWLWLGLGRILTTNREFPWALIHAAYRLYSMGIQVPKNIGLIYMVGTSNKLVPEMASDI